MRCKAFETLFGTVCMTLCVKVYPHLTYLLLSSFFLLAVLFTSNFDVRMPSFLSHYWIPVL